MTVRDTLVFIVKSGKRDQSKTLETVTIQFRTRSEEFSLVDISHDNGRLAAKYSNKKLNITFANETPKTIEADLETGK